jgi:hypothetical protein
VVRLDGGYHASAMDPNSIPLWLDATAGSGMFVLAAVAASKHNSDDAASKHNSDEQPLDNSVGDDNVVIGRAPRVLGSGNVIVNTGDAYGNVVIPGGTAIGRGAWADETSVALGAGAGAGRRRSTSMVTRPAAPATNWWEESWLVTLLGGVVVGLLLSLLHLG